MNSGMLLKLTTRASCGVVLSKSLCQSSLYVHSHAGALDVSTNVLRSGVLVVPSVLPCAHLRKPGKHNRRAVSRTCAPHLTMVLSVLPGALRRPGFWECTRLVRAETMSSPGGSFSSSIVVAALQSLHASLLPRHHSISLDNILNNFFVCATSFIYLFIFVTKIEQ